MWLRWLLLAALAQAADPLVDAERLIAAGEPRAALGKLERTPAGVRRHLLAARAHDLLNQPAEAVAEIEAALVLEPANEAAHLQLGQVFLSNNTPRAAVEVFSDAQQLFPNSFLVRLGKGIALKELGRYSDAAAELQLCLEAQPDSGLAFDALATSLLHEGKLAELASLAQAFVQRNGSDFRGHYYLAAAAERRGAPAGEVLTLLQASLDRNANFAATHALAGKVLLHAGRHDDAAGALEKAVALRPDHVPSHMTLAAVYRKLGREEDAAREFQRVRELNERARQGKTTLVYRRGKP